MKRASKLDQKIGEKIRANRISKKRSRVWLGKQIDRSYQQIQKYETGKDRIAASCLASIAEALETEISLFFPG
jgi:hypothetical protein